MYNASDTTIKDSLVSIQLFIQQGDLLSIKVYSISNGVDAKADAPYNLSEQATGAATGFLVDGTGNIEYPQIGSLHVEGLTREQVAEIIKKKLEGQLTQPSVIVRFLNFKVTVLGEVRNPGPVTAATDRLTILEALGIAGDVTEFGQRNNVKVLREINGQKQIASLDLTSKNIFNSPYYRLQQNDVVIVEQSGKKQKQQEQQTLAQQIGIASSIITAIALILNIIK